MSVTGLKRLLSSGGIDPGNVRPLAIHCAKWFAASPGLTPLTLQTIFSDLADHWDGQQGAPTAEFERFRDELLPELEAFAASLPNLSDDEQVPYLRSIAITYRDCRTAVGW
jgi:hypothetical protein